MATLDAMHSWCRANGISVSLCQDSQRSAKDILDEQLCIGNSAPVYSGNEMKVVPYDEVSAVGNGEVYIAPTASGPIADLTDDDFSVGKDSKALPVTVSRKKRTDCDNVVSIEHIDRSIDYAHRVTSACDQKAVAMYGPRKGGTLDAADLGINNPSGSKSLLSIHSSDVAQKIASILAKRGAAGVNQYAFTLKAEWFWLEAMDLVRITDERLGLNQKAVRITNVKETADRTYEITADEFIYGLNHPDTKDSTAATGTLVSVSVDPGLINTPIIFEPPTAMLGGGNAQLWFLVSGADPNYGGCVGYVSVDGGSTYSAMGNIGPATTGELTADYADSTSDPDTTHQLKVDLTESNGELDSESQQIADGFADPCYVGTHNSPADTNFEVVCPTVATLTGTNAYTMDSYIRRAVQGTSHMDHAAGSRFGVLDSAAFKVDIPSQWFGKTLHFKFPAYNKVGGQMNDLADCVDYTYTLRGPEVTVGINEPILFQDANTLWCAVSSIDQQYSGCAIVITSPVLGYPDYEYASGSSGGTIPLRISGSSKTGRLVGAITALDSTITVDLRESAGVIPPTGDFVIMSSATIPFEYVSYSGYTPGSSPFIYVLTGVTRGKRYSNATSHADGSRLVCVSDITDIVSGHTSTGFQFIVQTPYDFAAGHEISLKFDPSLNSQDWPSLSTHTWPFVWPYYNRSVNSYRVTYRDPYKSDEIVLWQPDSTHIAVGPIISVNGRTQYAAINASFPLFPVGYQARLLPITAPTSPTTYYVTVHDSLYRGEPLKSGLAMDSTGTLPDGSSFAYQGYIDGTSLLAGGSGYAVGDTGSIVFYNNTSAKYEVLTVDGSGAVLTYKITDGGADYWVNIECNTATGGAQPGSGSGFRISVNGNIGGLVGFDPLTFYWETNDSKVGVAGYTYLGAIMVTPNAVGVTATSGGMPRNNTFVPTAGADTGDFYIN